MEKQIKHISKLMSLVLRHKPEEIGLQLDENGWADVQELIGKMNAKGIKVNFELIDSIVQTSDKKRFAFSEDKIRIRANQGHSIQVELNLSEAVPADILYHGTAVKNIDSILKMGLNKQSRQHVHLSSTMDTAMAVGSRHGKPVVLKIKAKEMFEAGFVFFFQKIKCGSRIMCLFNSLRSKK